MGVSKNRGTSKSSISIGFSIINHPFWGTPIFGNTHVNHIKSLPSHSTNLAGKYMKIIEHSPPNLCGFYLFFCFEGIVSPIQLHKNTSKFVFGFGMGLGPFFPTILVTFKKKTARAKKIWRKYLNLHHFFWEKIATFFGRCRTFFIFRTFFYGESAAVASRNALRSQSHYQCKKAPPESVGTRSVPKGEDVESVWKFYTPKNH